VRGRAAVLTQSILYYYIHSLQAGLSVPLDIFYLLWLFFYGYEYSFIQRLVGFLVYFLRACQEGLEDVVPSAARNRNETAHLQ
jgi:hypothetical protein